MTKIPRFAFEKFPGADTDLTTSMKSVGEAMAIGRTFAESVQKALRSMETGLTGFDDVQLEDLGQGDDKNVVRAAVSRPTLRSLVESRAGVSRRLLARRNSSVLQNRSLVPRRDQGDRRYRSAGHRARPAEVGDAASRAQSAGLLRCAPGEARRRRPKRTCARARNALGVAPVFKRIDTCAAEFASPTAYMYSTYETGLGGAPVCEAAADRPKDKIIILGGGPNRIGQGIEFDYCCCHACFALTKAGYETIMVNCNPETVSTDYDTSDRLYFEPLTAEDVLEIIARREQRTARSRASSCSSAARRR